MEANCTSCDVFLTQSLSVRHAWACEVGAGSYLFPPSPLLISKQAHRHRKVALLRPHIFAIWGLTTGGQRHTHRHVWVIRKSRDPAAPHQLPLPHIGCQQATSLVQHRGGGCDGETLHGPSHRPPWQHMNQSEWRCHMHWAVTSLLDTRTLYHHSELRVTLTGTYSAPKQRGRPTLNSCSASVMMLGLSSLSVRRHASSVSASAAHDD